MSIASDGQYRYPLGNPSWGITQQVMPDADKSATKIAHRLSHGCQNTLRLRLSRCRYEKCCAAPRCRLPGLSVRRKSFPLKSNALSQLSGNRGKTCGKSDRHREERSDAAIQAGGNAGLLRLRLAMTDPAATIFALFTKNPVTRRLSLSKPASQRVGPG